MGSAASVDVSSFIDRQRISRLQIRVLLLCASVMLLDGFDTQAIGYIAPAVTKAWHLNRAALGPVFGAGLLGGMVGAVLFGTLADRLGRKKIAILCTCLFGAFSLMTTQVTSLNALLILRFLTGLGLGGAMPNSVALVSEYSPQRRRATMVTVTVCGFSIGAALGGFIAARLLPGFGWPAVFLVGGAVPLVLAPALILGLPESIRFLVLQRNENSTIAGILSRIAPETLMSASAAFVIHEEKPSGWPAAHLFMNGRAIPTAMLWVAYFCNLVCMYFLTNWLPTVINGSGVPLEKAVIATAMFQVGGTVGAIALGRTIDKFGPHLVLAVTFVLGALLVAPIGSLGSSAAVISTVVFGAGFCVVGGQVGLNAVAAGFYPTFIRSTGIGWALGVGRFGSVISPVIGGVLLGLGWRAPMLLFAAAVPLVIAAGSLVIMGVARRGVDQSSGLQTAGEGSGARVEAF